MQLHILIGFQSHVDLILSPSNRCVTVSGIIFHSASSFHQWPCMSMAWPSTLPSSMTMEPSPTPPPARGCSSAPAGVKKCMFSESAIHIHFLFQLNDGFWQKWMQAELRRTSAKIAGWHFLAWAPATHKPSQGTLRQSSETSRPSLPRSTLYNFPDAFCLRGLII